MHVQSINADSMMHAIPVHTYINHLLTISSKVPKPTGWASSFISGTLHVRRVPHLQLQCYVLMLAISWCTYTGFKCYCVSRWLAWCSHGYCDVMDQVITIYLGSRVLSVILRVCSGPMQSSCFVVCFSVVCSCAIELLSIDYSPHQINRDQLIRRPSGHHRQTHRPTSVMLEAFTLMHNCMQSYH